MGCAQSTVKDQVHDTTPEAVPAAPVSEVAPVATEAEAAAPVEEAAAAPVAETPAEESAAPVETLAEEAVAAPVEEVAAPVEEAPAASEAEPAAVAPVEEVAAAPVEEEVAPVEEAAATPEVAAEEPAVVEAEVAVVAEVAEVAEVAIEAEPETEVAPVVDETPQSGLVFVSAGVTFGDKGVAYYNYNGSNAEDPALDVKVSKRFNDFKALHAEIATIMANESNVAPEHQDKFKTYPALPALPKTSLFRGRSNKKQTEDREAQFLKILNAIAKHPIAAESPKFKAFMA